MTAKTEQSVDQPNLMTVNEVAEALRVSNATVRRMVEAQELETVRIRSAIRIRGRSVQAILAA